MQHQQQEPGSAQRLILFLFLSMGFVWLWGTFVTPKLFPPKPQPVAEAGDEGEGDAQLNENDATEVADGNADDESEAAEVAVPANAEVEEQVAENPHREITIGERSAKGGYFLEVLLSSTGGVIEAVHAADPQFIDIQNPDQQVQLLGTNSTQERTFALAVESIDSQLAKFNTSLNEVEWKVEENSKTPKGSTVVFSFTAPDQTLQVVRKYFLPRSEAPDDELESALRSDPRPWMIDLDITVRNLSSSERTVDYELLGPVGIVLENEEHTRKFRDAKLEFVDGEDDTTISAKEIAGNFEDILEEAVAQGRVLDREEINRTLAEKERFTSSIRYAGIDVQSFAALVVPRPEVHDEPTITTSQIKYVAPQLIYRDVEDVNRSDITLLMTSNPATLSPAGGELDDVTHRYSMYVGPKRRELLDPEPLAAARVLDYGMSGFIARAMHGLLDLFHSIGMPYALAIICLTILVRSCLFPLSRKQALSAKRMKELQPKIQELKAKYGDDKEKFTRAQMELWRKHKINPLGGCLPLLFQFPIFIGLYTALNTAVDLRGAQFLWIDNLAAPDKLFRMPFSLPFLGQDFNILPCITVVLFLTQQKLFMPPPTDEQSAMQQKMMNYMTIFFGFLFWHQPAGLCLYFIASSVWGIMERKLLDYGKHAAPIGETPSVEVVDGEQSASGKSKKSSEKSKKQSHKKSGNVAVAHAEKEATERQLPGFFQRLVDAAANANQTSTQSTTRKTDRPGSKKSRKR